MLMLSPTRRNSMIKQKKKRGATQLEYSLEMGGTKRREQGSG